MRFPEAIQLQTVSLGTGVSQCELSTVTGKGSKVHLHIFRSLKSLFTSGLISRHSVFTPEFLFAEKLHHPPILI